MRFQLVIAEGKEAGREFLFEQAAVLIGRTPECDVVLYDPGVSRQHARIFREGSTYFVEDMGSSNGTKVNGNLVRRAELKIGDAIGLGPVVFTFGAPATAALEGPPTGENLIADVNTRIVSQEDIRRKMPKEVLAPKGASPQELNDLTRARTRTVPRASDKALAKLAEFDEPPTDERPRAKAPSRGQLTAAEKARIRRESSQVGAGLRIFWAEASGLARNLVMLAIGVVGLGLFGLVYYVALWAPDGRVKLPPEPTELTSKRIEESFGLGEHVDYERADQKIFDFQYNAPSKAVVLLHFQAKDISNGEVVVSVNGVDIGKVPPDVLGSNEREHELLVPPNVLKKGERNKLTFDNTLNPPGSETWRIWNLHLEVAHLPQLAPDQLVRDATHAYQRGQQTFERRDVGAANRYEAWKDFRGAWLMLEAHDDPKPELYSLARDKVKEAQLELDRICAKLLLEAEASFNQNQFEAARLTLEHVKEYFPGTEQPCPYIAEEKRGQYGL